VVFTDDSVAITHMLRAKGKAWVRIAGVGRNMDRLSGEIDKVFESNFRLSFSYPSIEQLSEMDRIDQSRRKSSVLYAAF
jgi:superfamily I DNA and RNA helicase